MRTTLFALAAVLTAAPLQAQRDIPRRPRLDAAADTNDARAYFRLGEDLLQRRPRDAAAAFYWASQIDPGSADALYGRHVALLMSEPRRLVDYLAGDVGTRRRPEVQAIDSLYFRALRLDPFLRRRFERHLVREWVIATISRSLPPGSVDVPAVAFFSDEVLDELPPMPRARLLAGEGRLQQALAEFDAALRQRNRRWSEPLRAIRHERGRMFALAGNDSMALVELRAAVDAGVEEETDELVWFYESKAVLEHSMGRVHETAGNTAAAREAYARALVEDLAYHPAHVRLGVLALAEGDTATALQELALAVDVAPDDAPTRMGYATLLITARRLPEAEAQLLAAIDAAPHYADPWIMLGMVRDWRGEGDAAAAYRGFLARARRDDRRRAQVEPLVASAP